jgi:transcription antitermination factor NusG
MTLRNLLLGQIEEVFPRKGIYSDKELPWYALQVRSRHEKLVASTLLSKGYEGFLPVCHKKSRWSDRYKDVLLPLFPGYVFCRFEAAKRLPVLVTPGVVRVLGIGGSPHPVEEEEISAVLAIVASGLYAEPYPFLRTGQRVRIEQGSLSGVEGILAGSKGPARLIISLSLLQRSVAVEIDRDWVAAVDAPKDLNMLESVH